MTQEKSTQPPSVGTLWWLVTLPWRLLCGAGDWCVARFRGVADIFTGGPLPDDQPRPKKTDSKRNTAWGLATVAGVLALLSMLAWQIHGLLTDDDVDSPSDLRLAEKSLADNYSSPMPPNAIGGKKPAEKNNGGFTIEPPDNLPAGDNNNGEPPVIVASDSKTGDQFGFGVDPPKKSDQQPLPKKSEPPSFKLVDTRDNNNAAKKSPFDTGDDPKTLPAPKKDAPGNSVVQKKTPELSFPAFGAPEKKQKEPPVVTGTTDNKQPTFPGFAPEKKEPKTTTPPPNVAKKTGDGFPAFGSAKDEKKTVTPPPKIVDTGKDTFPGFAPVKKQPAEKTEPPKVATNDEQPLSLEIIRNDGLANGDFANFLVTSLLSTESAIAKIGGDVLKQSDGWKAVRWVGDSGSILPVRYNATASPEAVAGSRSITVGSTAALTWTVGTPKLNYQIVVLRSGGVGDAVALRLLVTNSGSATLTNVAVHLDLPAALKYKIGRQLEHRIPRLEPGKTHVARLTPVAVKAGRVRITGKVIAGEQTVTAEQTLTIGTRTASRSLFRTSTSRTRTGGCCGGSVLR